MRRNRVQLEHVGMFVIRGRPLPVTSHPRAAAGGVNISMRPIMCDIAVPPCNPFAKSLKPSSVFLIGFTGLVAVLHSCSAECSTSSRSLSILGLMAIFSWLVSTK